ncbi:MbtH family protein [Amycolatopsis sp. cmx-4-61]|uniref:MbtH family protein n=1 Tax=Amycolatopsis sp. cmx-4-61 TaxID=2790937 RepID=UPI00397DEACB
MTNPFDDPDKNYTVLVNAAGEHSLWVSGIPVPAGWEVTYGPRGRQACLDHIAENWRDLRPNPAARRAA